MLMIGRTNVNTIKTPNKLYLYNQGIENTAITGDWLNVWYYENYKGGKATKESNCLRTQDNSNSYGNWVWFTKNTLNLSGYTKLCFEISVYNVVAQDGYPCSINLGVNLNPVVTTTSWLSQKREYVALFSENFQTGDTCSRKTVEIDISKVNNGTIFLLGQSHNFSDHMITLDCFKIWLE